MPINKNELTKEMVEKALNVKDAKELMALAKSEGIELTKEEAEAYMAELEDYELDEDTLKNVAGGGGISINVNFAEIAILHSK